jgi:6-phosphogluconolactonase
MGGQFPATSASLSKARSTAAGACAARRQDSAADLQARPGRLNWKKVTIIPTDERLVPLTDENSNIRAIAQAFLPSGARVFPISSDIADYKLAGNSANAKLADLKFPLDLAWLGVGADGHTAPFPRSRS